MKFTNGWSAVATFEGEFSDVTRSYAWQGHRALCLVAKRPCHEARGRNIALAPAMSGEAVEAACGGVEQEAQQPDDQHHSGQFRIS